MKPGYPCTRLGLRTRTRTLNPSPSRSLPFSFCSFLRWISNFSSLSWILAGDRKFGRNTENRCRFGFNTRLDYYSTIFPFFFFSFFLAEQYNISHGGCLLHIFIKWNSETSIFMAHLIYVFKLVFLFFKQYYTYFYTLFHPHIFLKNANNVTRTTLPNRSLVYEITKCVV